MAHPAIWSPQLFFYPIGNTPATSLAEYLSPDEDAAILVLGCGDPRSTLYTIDSDSKNPFNRALDFTFCDNEPAVLARNIFIYTLLFDQCDEETVQCLWKIYLDIFIDKTSFDLIVSHCNKLAQLSNSLEEWKSSRYGRFLRFCTKDTLAAVRRYWNSYLFKDQNPTAMKARVLQEMKKADKSTDGFVTTALRSAGIMMLQLSLQGSDHFKHYWKHGVASTEPAEVSSATHVNPTLLYSSAGDKFNVHYGTDPILCFHLANALAPMEGIPNTPAKDMNAIIPVLKLQFSAWSRSFHEQMNSPDSKIQLRFFAGNAMTLCKSLRYVSQTGYLDTAEYTNSWGGSTISFVDEYFPDSSVRPPLTFNVIETSNIADHLGFLNLLLIAAPLLHRKATSALFTNCLLGSEENGLRVSALQKIGVELPLISLLFGLVPERAISQNTSQSISHELVLSTLSQTPQYFEFNCWRVSAPEAPGQGYAFTCDATELGSALFSVYLKLFEDEGIRRSMQSMKSHMFELKHYVRDTFVELLRFVKDTYTGNWTSVMDRVMGLIERDTTLIVGMNNYQDFCRGLEQAGLFKIVPDPNSFPPAARGFCFQGWGDIPKVVCVVLVVPRAKIQRLLDDSGQISTPNLQCEVKLVNGHSVFTTFQPVFGTIKQVDPAPNKKSKVVVIHEDPGGWQGKADLVAHFLAPAWLFVQRPASEIQIGLNMFGMSATVNFMSKLGMHLSIYSTTLADSKRAFIVRDRPRVDSQTISQNGSPTLSVGPNPATGPLMHGIATRQAVAVKFQGTTISSLTIRSSISDYEAKSRLSDKATQVEAKPISVTAVRISFKGFKSTVYFPYPVDTTALVTRIARKSSYIEVEGRVAQSQPVPVELNPFPVILTPNGPRQLSMHYLTLDHLPAFRSPFPADNDPSQWLKPHFMLSLTEEKKAAESLGKPSGLLDMKESIVHLFLNFFEKRQGRPAVTNLSDPENGGIYTMLFVSSVRIDLTAHTVVADTCVLPLTVALISRESTQKALLGLQKSSEGQFQIKTPAHEVPWWKAFLPTVVERCRTWSHNTDKCEYNIEGHVPRSLKMDEDPLCSCGRGKNLGRFGEVKEWSAFKPFVTRAAIGFPFPTSLQGKTAAELKEMLDSGKRGAEKVDSCAKCGHSGKPKLLFCSRCKSVKYCSAECQKADWKVHKGRCHK